MTIESALAEIKNKLIAGLAFSGIVMVLSCVLFFVKTASSICLCVFILSVAFAVLILMKYGFCNQNNIEIIEGRCIEKKRSGYRKQYVEYIFQDDNGHSFIIMMTHREKFTKEINYQICCRKNAAEKEKIIGSELLCYAAC